MSRATLDQLRQLGLDAYGIDKVADADKQMALDAAMARIDAALNTQFPDNAIIPPYPLDIVQCECIFASWTLLTAAGYNPANPGTDVNILAQYNEWKDYLNKVSKGKLVPNVVLSADPGPPGVTGPSVITSTQRGYSERGGIPWTSPCPNTGPFSSD